MEHTTDFLVKLPISLPPHYYNDNFDNAIHILPLFDGTLTFISLSDIRSHKSRVGALWPKSCSSLSTTLTSIDTSLGLDSHPRQRSIPTPRIHCN
jgi:hypothetical protein